MNIYTLNKAKKQIMANKNVASALVIGALLVIFASFFSSGDSEACCGGDGGCCGGGAGFGDSTSGFGGGFGCTNTNGGMGGGGNGGWSGGWIPPHLIPAPTASITCAPSMVDDGEPSIVEWDCGGGATGSSGEGFSTSNGLSGHLSVFPVQESTYTVTCSKTTGSVHSASESCTIGINAPTDPEGGGPTDPDTDPEGGGPTDPDPEGGGPDGPGIVTGGGGVIDDYTWFECFPRNITGGESVRLRWNCADSTTSTLQDVTAGAPLHTNGASSGFVIVTPEDENRYSLTCNDENYTASCVISVSSDPSVDIQATPLLLNAGSLARITWSSVAATGCTVSGPGLSSVELAGSEEIVIDTESTYKIECDDELTDTVTIRVIPTWNEQ